MMMMMIIIPMANLWSPDAFVRNETDFTGWHPPFRPKKRVPEHSRASKRRLEMFRASELRDEALLEDFVMYGHTSGKVQVCIWTTCRFGI